MEITLGGIFVVMFISSGHGFPVPGFHNKNANFQILRKHPQLLKCAQSVLQENTYLGCRVSQLTGECQGLSRSWGLNPTTEQGYAYAKKQFVKENFQQPPLTLSTYWFIWDIPIVLNTGARIDISMSIANWVDWLPREFFHLELYNGKSPSRDVLHKWLFRPWATHYEIREITHGPGPGPTGRNLTLIGLFESTERLPAPFMSKAIFTISLLAQPDSLAIFVNDEELTTFKLSTHIKIMTHLLLQRSTSIADPISVYSVKFTGE